ncbi:MAG: hypothetical protein H6832_18915 [Planctomycetes bacterium]|nr:hypothetical protein [Planctomycetota bacterium]MCB9920482.1 hypothetical protein [Planctomycetota bacterium]
MTRATIVLDRKLIAVRARPAIDAGLAVPSRDGETDRKRLDPRRDLRNRIEEERLQRRAIAESIRSALTTVDIEDRLDAMRDWILDLAFGLASQVLEREIDRGAYEISAALRSCFDAAVETAKILRVLVHADDVVAARSVIETASAENGLREAPRVDPDARVARGTCIVVTDAGRFRHDPRTSLEDAIVRMGQAVRS